MENKVQDLQEFNDNVKKVFNTLSETICLNNFWVLETFTALGLLMSYTATQLGLSDEELEELEKLFESLPNRLQKTQENTKNK